ncbi:spore coat protein [Caldalkalibacillus thermarum]|uniref:cytidylyltransferase domain-containing protein n=1 Tax=Caldalkalibacillus thermarum TaxID=296745 RepID=UPI0016661C9C|nr:glycosyltransferase family protein [Caldalkalibacillus thermarum]GGK34123.1 spore coat protein [Caldalkalibacillus thermarum]
MQNKGQSHQNPNVVAIIQARMGSTRLPGKVLKKVLAKPLLEYQIERLNRCKLINTLVVATTTKQSDNPIVELCNQLGVNVFRGSEEDVLQRYYDAACKYKADVVVRLTADCPLIDPEVVDKVISCYLENQEQYDYVSNTLIRTYPRGLDTEVFSFQALKQAHQEAHDPQYREHVTSYLYLHPEKFRLFNVSHPIDYSHHRWTVDTGEDFELIRRIIEHLYPQNAMFKMKETITLLEYKPEWALINAHIEQKKINQE